MPTVNRSHARKIFGIGLPKTGTKTLGYCFMKLRFSHQSYDMRLAKQVRNNKLAEALLVARRYDTFEDWPWFLIYKELDQAFPNSKFVLTTRKDTSTYIDSLRGHHELEGIHDSAFAKPCWWNDVFGFEPSQWDYEASAREYERHNREVCSYFNSRKSDLLVVCWEAGDGWRELCNFLEVPAPTEPFPQVNMRVKPH